MSTKSSRNGLNPFVVATGIALLAAAGAGVYSFFNGGLLVSRSSRFYCQLRQDKSLGSDVYTVMYRHDLDRKPWLKMVSTLGGGYTPDRRDRAGNGYLEAPASLYSREAEPQKGRSLTPAGNEEGTDITTNLR
ncbi:MAG: hypothetical protein AB4352_00705 [Hormoscilla sp.]